MKLSQGKSILVKTKNVSELCIDSDVMLSESFLEFNMSSWLIANLANSRVNANDPSYYMKSGKILLPSTFKEVLKKKISNTKQAKRTSSLSKS